MPKVKEGIYKTLITTKFYRAQEEGARLPCVIKRELDGQISEEAHFAQKIWEDSMKNGEFTGSERIFCCVADYEVPFICAELKGRFKDLEVEIEPVIFRTQNLEESFGRIGTRLAQCGKESDLQVKKYSERANKIASLIIGKPAMLERVIMNALKQAAIQPQAAAAVRQDARAARRSCAKPRFEGSCRRAS